MSLYQEYLVDFLLSRTKIIDNNFFNQVGVALHSRSVQVHPYSVEHHCMHSALTIVLSQH